MNARWVSLVVGVLSLAILGAIFISSLSIRRPLLRGPTGEALADPDSYQRYGLVRRALAGEGVRLRWIDWDNAPYGRINEWTSPVTTLIVVATRVLQATGLSEADALARVCLWYGPVMGLIQLLAWCVLGYRAGGWPMAWAWMVAWIPLLPVMRTTAFGCIDHHSLHQLAAIVMVAGPVASQQRLTRLAGAVCGMAAAIGLWSGASEVLPFWWLVAGLGIWELWPRTGTTEANLIEPRIQFWRGWWTRGAVITTLAWVWEFWPRPFHGHLEFLSAWHVMLWFLAGGLMEYLHAKRPGRLQAWRAVGVALLLALFAAGGLRGFQWDRLHVMQDARFAAQTAAIHEFESWFALGWWAGVGRIWRGSGLLWLFAGVGFVMWRWLSRRERWVLIVSVVLAGFTLHQLRWESFSVVPLVTLAGLVARVITQSHPVWLPALVFVATLPAWGTIAIVQKQSKTLAADPMMGPHATKFALTAVSRCLGEEDRGAVVLAGWDYGAVLAGLGQVRVIGSAYWSNLDGLYAGHELLTMTDPDRFRDVVRRRQVRWLLVPGPDRFRWDIQQAFLVLHGRLPSTEEIEQTVAWQIATNPDLPRLKCEELKSIAPGWEVVRLAEP